VLWTSTFLVFVLGAELVDDFLLVLCVKAVAKFGYFSHLLRNPLEVEKDMVQQVPAKRQQVAVYICHGPIFPRYLLHHLDIPEVRPTTDTLEHDEIWPKGVVHLPLCDKVDLVRVLVLLVYDVFGFDEHVLEEGNYATDEDRIAAVEELELLGGAVVHGHCDFVA
jgi:hypothetical protein